MESNMTGSTDVHAPAGDLGLQPACDICGQAVTPEDTYSAELSVSSAMCPTPMNFHRSCYDQASSLWQPDPESYCNADSRFPETGQWNQMQRAAEEAQG